MAIILDADVIIQGEKGLFDLRAWLSSYPDEPFEISAITVAELWHGLERASGSHRFKRQRYLDAVLETFPVAPYTEVTAYSVLGSIRNIREDDWFLRFDCGSYSHGTRKSGGYL